MKSVVTLQRLRTVSVLLLLAAGLAACGGGGGVHVTPPPPFSRLEDMFGAAFGAAFRVVATSEPVAVAAGDIIPLSLTTEPIALH